MEALIAYLIWQVLFPAAIAVGVAYLIAQNQNAPRPKIPGSPKIELPTAEEGRPFPVLGGKCRIRGLNALSPIFNKSRKVMVQHDQILGIKYFCGLFLGVGIGEINIKQFWFGESVVWPTPKNTASEAADGQTYAAINADEIWGGWINGGAGGVNGKVDIQFGGSAQTLNAMLSAKYGSDQPAYRSFTSLVFRGTYIGTQPNIRPISVLGKRTDKMCDYSAMWYIAKANVGPDDDLNAIHWVYELLTSTIVGRGIDTSLIGDSFIAAADTCYSEGYGVSFCWDWATDDIGSVIDQIEKIVDGKLYFDLDTEKYEFGLNRPDYDPETLEQFDENDFWIESAGYLSPGLIPSKVIIKFEDRIYGQKRIAYDDDIAMLARQNDQSCIDEKDYSAFVKSGALANKIASRDQYVFSSMPKRFTLRCLRTMSHLHETDVFKIAYSELSIASMIVRLVSIDRGSLTDGECIIEVIEDVFGQAYTVYGEPPESEATEETVDDETELYDQETTAIVFVVDITESGPY